MAQQKTDIEKNFDWLERTIEGLLNDFEGGITEKDETIKQFFELIFDKLVKEIQDLRDQLSNQVDKPVKVNFAEEIDKHIETAKNDCMNENTSYMRGYIKGCNKIKEILKSKISA